MAAKLHLAENALALHLFLQRLESLVDIIVTDENLHASFLLNGSLVCRVLGRPKKALRVGADSRVRCKSPSGTRVLAGASSGWSAVAGDQGG
jgi:hypothetical protein